MLTPPNWQAGAKSPKDETTLRRKPFAGRQPHLDTLSPRLVELLRDLFPNSESALRNGLAGAGDLAILEYASSQDFILISTDSDFKGLLNRISGAKVIILRSCNYPTDVAAEVLRRNAIRIAELPGSEDHLVILDR
jgi:predicted nuclease of predicted toxin-antitoxin system